MNDVRGLIQYINGNEPEAKLICSILVVIVGFLLSRGIKNISYKLLKDSKKFYRIKHKLNLLTGIIIFTSLLYIWFDSISDLTTYIGLLSAGIAVALREIFTNIAGWLFIESRKPFSVGHRISIGNQKGDVIDKRIFQFTLMEVSSFEEGEQSTGRIIDVPNAFVFMHPIINYTKGFEYIWNEIKVLLTFESNWRKAKELLLAIVDKEAAKTVEHVSEQIKEASRTYMIHYKNLTPIVYTDIKDSGIQLTIRFFCEPKRRRIVTNKVWEEILEMLEDNEDIQLAYPTKRVVN